MDKTNNTELPPKEIFCSKLKQNGSTDEEYQQALDCWDKSGCKTIKIYMMIYLETDVLLSVDVFENFRVECLDYYEIASCYTYYTPRLTWLFGLKYTDVRLKYYSEDTASVYDTIQKSIRAGLASVLGHCYVECKNRKIDTEYRGKENYLKYLHFYYVEVYILYTST